MAVKILTVSSANMDLNMRVSEAPKKGQTILGGEYKYVSGGKGANSATTVAKLGGESVFCAALGNDANGNTLKSIYEKLGIVTDQILMLNDVPTGLATVTVEDDGANRIVVFSGANAHLSAEHAIESAKKCAPDAVFCHFEIPYETVCAVSQYCYEQNIPLFVDAGPASADMDLSKLAPMCVFSPNETETEIFTGICPSDDKSALAAAKSLQKLVKAEYYILKLGSRGVAIYDGEKLINVPTYPVKVVDTTAAGDSFTAALTLEFIRSRDMERACRFGNAVASITVSKQGAGDAIPDSDELERFISKNGIVL